jgi:hypothetical protein
VQIRDPRLYRGGIEAIHHLGVRGERQTEAEVFKPLPGRQLLFFWYEPEADGRRNDPYLITTLESRGDHCSRILVRGLQYRQRFPVAVLPGDVFQVLLGYPDLAKPPGQSELLNQ